MRQTKLLDRLEKCLQPKEAVLVWLEEIAQYPNVNDYVRFLKSLPEKEAPITRITRQLDEATREAMKGQPKAVIAREVRQAARDVVFLFKLHLQVNSEILVAQRAWNVMAAALAYAQLRMETESEFRNALRDMKSRRFRDTGIWLNPQHKTSEFNLWRTVAEEYLVELHAFSGAVTNISRSYFNGHPILFADMETYLADLIMQTEQMIGMFNNLCLEENKELIVLTSRN